MKKDRTMVKRILSCVVGAILIILGSFSASYGSNVLIERANKAYTDGHYEEASGLYQKVIDAGNESPELFYNMGNTLFKMNNFPGAILWYERAKRLDPGNEDIDFNLNVANTKIADKIEPVPEMFYLRWYYGLVNQLPTDGWAWISILCFLAAIAGATLYLVATRLFFRKTGFWASATFLILFLFSTVFALSARNQVHNVHEAIIFTPSVTVKSSPDEKSVDLFVLHEGAKVRIMDKIGIWYEIRIANGSVGWLPSGVMEQI